MIFKNQRIYEIRVLDLDIANILSNNTNLNHTQRIYPSKTIGNKLVYFVTWEPFQNFQETFSICRS